MRRLRGRSTHLRICAAAAFRHGQASIRSNRRYAFISRSQETGLSPAGLDRNSGESLQEHARKQNKEVLSSSWRSASVIPATANLLAEYAHVPAGATIRIRRNIHDLRGAALFAAPAENISRVHHAPEIDPHQPAKIVQREISSNLRDRATQRLFDQQCDRPCGGPRRSPNPACGFVRDIDNVSELEAPFHSEAAVCCSPASSNLGES